MSLTTTSTTNTKLLDANAAADGSLFSASAGETGSQSAQSHSDNTAITPEQEFFLYELETSDSTSSIGLVLRAIYDGGDVDRFSHALEKKIKHYDKDISKLCSFHFQGYIDSVKELLDLRPQCQELRKDIELSEEHLGQSCVQLEKRLAEMVKYRKMQRNIASAVDAMSLCLPMLEKYAKLRELMQGKKYYQALKTLEQLEHTYLPQGERYRFVQNLSKSVAAMRQQIKDASFAQFKDFLENVRKYSVKIGELALKHAAEYHDMDSEANQAQRKHKARQLLSPKVALANKSEQQASDANNPFAAADSDDEDSDFSAQDLIDFSPVYRCCHIFTALGEKTEFEEYYREQRRKQAALLLETPNKMSSWTVDSYLTFFHEIIGFFVIEDHIMQTVPGLVTMQHRDTLWATAFEQIKKSLQDHFARCIDPLLMLKMKKLVLLVSLTMKSYGYKKEKDMLHLLGEFRDQYFEILMGESTMSFNAALKSDNYTPMTAEDEQAYQALLRRFPFHQKMNDAYPRKMPFSEMVPVIYEQLKAFVRVCLRFMEQLTMSQSEVEDVVRRKTNVLLERLCQCIVHFMNQKQSLVQLIQITINMVYLEHSCDSLDQFVSKVVGGGNASGALSSSSHLTRLKDDVFRDARSEAEQQIDNALCRKIDEFMELAVYDWEMTSAVGRASDYVSDMIAFLTSTFLSFTNLPPALARHVCMQACKYVSNRLQAYLIGPEPRSISMGAIEQFNLDVMQCELFTRQCPVAGFDEHTLEMTLADLRQLLDLVMLNEWSVYFADYGKPDCKYERVAPKNAAALLEKIIECERRKNTLFGNKDRKKLLDTILKQLKTMYNS